jgi:hypothetical protein
MKSTLTRRSVLCDAAKGVLGLVAATTIAPFFTCGCQKKEAKEAAKNDLEIEPCPNQESMSEQERAIRHSLKYVDKTPIAGRTCDNCKLYILPSSTSHCGGCKVVPGPIHPRGYCTAWIPRM